MIRKIGKTSLVLALVGVLAVLACMSCGGDDEVVGEEGETYDAVVCFRVNAAGTAFENIGSSKGGSVTYTATPQRGAGAFETVSGRKVFNTKGTKDGQWKFHWFEGFWDRYINVGYVDLGANTGDLLASLNNWSIETVFALPADHPDAIVDQFVWSFVDAAPLTNNQTGQMVAFGWREMYTRVVSPAAELNAGFTDDPWGAGTAYRAIPIGAWAHLVVTKTAGGMITSYINGTQMNQNTIDFPTTYTAGSFKVNALGKDPYMDIPAPAGDVAFGMDLANTKYFHFAIDNKAWSASEVTTRYMNSPVGKGQLVAW